MFHQQQDIVNVDLNLTYQLYLKDNIIFNVRTFAPAKKQGVIDRLKAFYEKFFGII